MSDYGCDAADVGDRMLFWLLPELVKFRQQLQHYFLIDVVGFGSLGSSIRAQMEFITNDTFDHRLGMICDKPQEYLVNLLVAGRQQKRFEQGVDVGRRLFHHSFGAVLFKNAPRLRDIRTCWIAA